MRKSGDLISQNFFPLINLERCNRCGACITGCPEEALTMMEQGPVFKNPVLCTYCTDCEAMCPPGAIRTPLIVTWGPEV